MTSVRQRLRWVKGTFIVFGKYGKKLFTSLFKKGGFTIFDVIMTSFPAMLLSTISLIVCIAGIIFAIVTFSSKLLTLVLTFFYTRVMATGDFGGATLIQNAVNILVPIVTLAVNSAALRFALDKNSNKKKVF